jgi:ubiquinone/menaquinone biosynthesis C-methylase UbiE
MEFSMNKIETTIKTYNKIVEEYVKIRDRDEKILRKFLEKFLKYLKGKRILDVGCGPGRDVKYFKERGYDPVGIDLSAEMIKFARKTCDAEFKIMDMRALEFADSSFDGAWCSASLFHLPRKDFKRVLKEIRRILKLQGILFISMIEGKGSEIRREKEEYHGLPRYFVYYRKKELDKILTGMGFEILEFERDKPIMNYFCKKI